MTELLNLHEHLTCYNYDHSGSPLIEVINFPEEREMELQIDKNEVVFILEGRASFMFRDSPVNEMRKGQVIFLPAGERFPFTVLKKGMVMVMRLTGYVKLCENYLLERLYEVKTSGSPAGPAPYMNGMGILEINPRMWYFIEGLVDNLKDGIRCKEFFDLKIKEFFFILRFYYPKNELRDFLSHILSGDTYFSEYVRIHSHKYRTVEELAASIHMSGKQFSKKFKAIFGKTAYNWMKEHKADSIRREITAGKKPFKMIALEYGFSSVSTFTRFCKTELGNTPLKLRQGGN